MLAEEVRNGREGTEREASSTLKAARDICDEAEKANRDFSDDERQKVAGYLKEASDLKAQLKKAEGDESLRKQILELGEGIEIAQKSGKTLQAVAAGNGATIGEQFVNAPEFKEWLSRFQRANPRQLKG